MPFDCKKVEKHVSPFVHTFLLGFRLPGSLTPAIEMELTLKDKARNGNKAQQATLYKLSQGRQKGLGE